MADSDARRSGLLYWLIILISVVTVITGVVQMLSPAFVLGLVGGEIDPTSRHFFCIIGMFMMLFGALLLACLRATPVQSAAILWCGLQKLGASVTVSLGVHQGIFSVLALAIASFDFVSGVLIIWYWNKAR